MADIIVTGVSDYLTGGLDSATVLISNVSPISARHPNGLASAVVQIETILGSGTSLKGAMADLVARLAVALGSDGKVALSDPTKLNGTLTVVNGGSGRSTLTAGRVLVGNAGSPMDMVTGLLYHGPTSVGAGSTIVHGGVQTISGTQALNGLHYYTDFTLNTGATVTLDDAAHRLIIVASSSITINGTIDAQGAGFTGGAATSAANGSGGVGSTGFTQPGGGGGGGNGTGVGGAGGGTLAHGLITTTGGAGGTTSVGGTSGSPVSGSAILFSIFDLLGGAGGGGGAGRDIGGATSGAGGRGGGCIVLIAPTIILGATAVLKTAGDNGVAGGANCGGGGGGGAGNLFMWCRVYTDNGCTFTLNGGTGGSGGQTSGGAGAAGIRQINIYA